MKHENRLRLRLIHADLKHANRLGPGLIHANRHGQQQAPVSASAIPLRTNDGLIPVLGAAFLSAVLLAGCGGSGGESVRGAAATASAHEAPQARSSVRSAPAAISLPGVPSNAVIEGIPNFHVVHPFLLRGAAPTSQGLVSLQKVGVKTVIDLRIAPKHVKAEREQVQALGMRFINLPMSDRPPTPTQVKTFLDTVNDPTRTPVFVHCEYGADRTGCMVGIYRERYDHWDFARTYAEMRHYGFKTYLPMLRAAVQKFGATA